MSIFLFIAVQTVAAPAPPSVILPSSKEYASAANHFKESTFRVLKDPKSAEIGDVIICAYKPSIKAAIVNVNAKNSYGAYTGFKALIVVESPTYNRVLSADGQPSTPEEYSEQRDYLAFLKACDPIIAAYDVDRRKTKP